MTSKRRRKRRGHDGKIAYATRKEALAALWDIRRNHPTWGYMNVYRCQFCPAYHLGHPPRDKKRRRKSS